MCQAPGTSREHLERAITAHREQLAESLVAGALAGDHTLLRLIATYAFGSADSFTPDEGRLGRMLRQLAAARVA